MSSHKALGRGLDALFNATAKTAIKPAETLAAAVPGNDIRELPVDQIKPNRFQPRIDFDPASLEELSISIKQHGLAQPLVVTESPDGGWELVVGERRLRASKLAGLKTIPCNVKKLNNRQRREIALIENIQRQDLNALEEAVAMDALMREYELTQESLAEALGKSRSAVANLLRLLTLHDDVQSALRSNKITEGHAKVLAGVTQHSEQLRLLKEIAEKNLTVRDLEALASGVKAPKKAAAGKAERKVSPEVKKFEEDFQRVLGRRVEIQTDGKKGWIRFSFYSPWDLDLLCKRLHLIDEKTPGPNGTETSL